VGEDECAPFPGSLSAGAITVTGLLEPLRFLPSEYGYTPDGELPEDEVFGDDAVIVVSAPGEEVPAFTLQATGVPPLQADVSESLQIDDGEDELIQWTAAGVGRIQLLLVFGHHGAPYLSLLVCETDDDGELVVPGDLIAQFPRPPLSVLHHPSWLARFNRDVIDTAAGPIELFVASRLEVYFQPD
jgi:hypothetical protein